MTDLGFNYIHIFPFNTGLLKKERVKGQEMYILLVILLFETSNLYLCNVLNHF